MSNSIKVALARSAIIAGVYLVLVHQGAPGYMATSIGLIFAWLALPSEPVE